MRRSDELPPSSSSAGARRRAEHRVVHAHNGAVAQGRALTRAIEQDCALNLFSADPIATHIHHLPNQYKKRHCHQRKAVHGTKHFLRYDQKWNGNTRINKQENQRYGNQRNTNRETKKQKEQACCG